MSSAQPELKESLRRRESAVGDGNGSARGVAALLHSFAEGRSKPKAKEQEVLDVATDYFLAHGYQGREHQRDGSQLRHLEGIDLSRTSAARSSCSKP